jgi:hypothetical protein
LVIRKGRYAGPPLVPPLKNKRHRDTSSSSGDEDFAKRES